MRIAGTTRLTGVVGDPVDHSRSPAMHNAAHAELHLDRCYVPLHVRAEALGDALAGLVALGFDGVNVTLPHKQAALRHCSTASPEARAAGAVNTLVMRAGQLDGHLTDGLGLLDALAETAPAALGGPVLLLGAGGSARAAAAALLGAGAPLVSVVARRPEAAQALAAALTPLGNARALDSASAAGPCSLVVNCTPIGGLSGLEELPLGADALDVMGAVADFAYRADGAPTPLVGAARQNELPIVDGLELLVRQGARSFELFTGLPAPLTVMRWAARARS